MNIKAMGFAENETLWKKYGIVNNILKMEEEAQELAEACASVRENAFLCGEPPV